MTRQPGSAVGFGRSDLQTFTIANGANGSAVTPLNFLRGHAYYVVICEDASFIPATTTLRAQVGYDTGATMLDLYEQNDPATRWTKGSLPVTGTLSFILSHAFGAQYLRFILSNNATGGSVVFKVYGFDPTTGD